MRRATLCLLVQGMPPSHVLLGLKKVGFGAGKYTGFGGKVEPGETPAQAAARELEEEAGVRVRAGALKFVGVLTFVFPGQPFWSQEVHVFLAREWLGEPVEGREMRPAWFPVTGLPFEEMWDDGAYWLPRVLAGSRIVARFIFEDDNETVCAVEMAPPESGDEFANSAGQIPPR